MRTFISILTVCMVIAMAFWAYRENYATQQALRETERLQAELREEQANLTVLKAEWSYLNRPSRLRDLTILNFDKLGLLPFHPDQFGSVDQIPYPPVQRFEGVPLDILEGILNEGGEGQR